MGYAGWVLFLAGLIAARRSVLTLAGKRRANSFKPEGDADSPFSKRLSRAHINSCENLPAFGALILVAFASGHFEVTDGLAPWVVTARVGQSVVHLASTHNLAVTLRFGFFAVQLAIQGLWLVCFVQRV